MVEKQTLERFCFSKKRNVRASRRCKKHPTRRPLNHNQLFCAVLGNMNEYVSRRRPRDIESGSNVDSRGGIASLNSTIPEIPNAVDLNQFRMRMPTVVIHRFAFPTRIPDTPIVDAHSKGVPDSVVCKAHAIWIPSVLVAKALALLIPGVLVRHVGDKLHAAHC